VHFGGGACQRIRLKVASIHTRTHTHTITHTHYHTHTLATIWYCSRISVSCAEEILKIGSVSKETWVDRLLKLPGLVQKVQAIASGEQPISFSNLNPIGLFSTERGKRDIEN